MAENRRAKRFKIHQMIQMSFGKEEFIASEGINLSETGMLCRTNAEIELHSRFYLLFEVPLASGKKEVSCDAQVVHSKQVDDGWEIGITFHDLRRHTQSILKDYIQSLEDVA